MRNRMGLLLFAWLLSCPAYGHIACRDVLRFESNYGRPHTRDIVLVSLSSYVTGYVSSMAVFGETLTNTARAETASQDIEWITSGISQTRFQAFKSLFFQSGSAGALFNEDNYKLAVQRVVDLCRANPQDTVINLFEVVVIDELLSNQP